MDTGFNISEPGEPGTIPFASATSQNPPRQAEMAVHAELIQFFINLSQGLGLPKSVGEIFGALYCSRSPLCFSDLVESSGTSKASVSQGLRVLKKIDAISAVNVGGDRRTYYRAERRIRPLLEGFLRETVAPQLRRGAEHLAQLQALPADDPFLNQRIDDLRQWNHQTRGYLASLAKANE